MMISHLYIYGFSQTDALYKHWMSNCADLGIDYWRQYPQLPAIELIQVYRHQVRHDHYSTQHGVQTDLVAATWRAIAKTHILEGLWDPRKTNRLHQQGNRKISLYAPALLLRQTHRNE